MRYPAFGDAKIAKIAMEEDTIESVTRGHASHLWHPIPGEQLTLEREDDNSHDRHQTSQLLASTLTPQ